MHIKKEGERRGSEAKGSKLAKTQKIPSVQGPVQFGCMIG